MSTIFNPTFSSGHTSLTANQLKLQKSLSGILSFQKCSQETKYFFIPPSAMVTGPRSVQVQTTSLRRTPDCAALDILSLCFIGLAQSPPG